MPDYGINVFFSCSFDKSDKEVVEYFRSMCEGFHMSCTNVDKATHHSPVREAEKMIQRSNALIVIATRRQERKNGKYIMPPSCQVEVGMALGLAKPVLLFAENGVSIEGFTEKIGAYALVISVENQPHQLPLPVHHWTAGITVGHVIGR